MDTVGFFGFGLTAAAVPTTFGVISAAAIDPLYDFNTIPVGQSIFLVSFQIDTTADGSTAFSFADRLVGTGTVNTA